MLTSTHFLTWFNYLFQKRRVKISQKLKSKIHGVKIQQTLHSESEQLSKHTAQSAHNVQKDIIILDFSWANKTFDIYVSNYR